MYWIYVLKCENEFYYVGMTQHLYKRLAKHASGDASKNTNENKVIEIIGLYRGNVNYKFNKYLKEFISYVPLREDKLYSILQNFDYDTNMCKEDIEKVENYITEHMHVSSIYNNVRGGKYLKGEKCDVIHTDIYNSRPMCNCKLPAEIQKRTVSGKVKFYFVCPLNNVWNNMRNEFKLIPIGKKCCFFKEYLDDIEVRIGYNI